MRLTLVGFFRSRTAETPGDYGLLHGERGSVQSAKLVRLTGRALELAG